MNKKLLVSIILLFIFGIAIPSAFAVHTGEGYHPTPINPPISPPAFPTLEEYCEYSVKNQLPTPWDYYCYDDPFDNPAREITLGYKKIIDDYTNCDTRDSKMACFEYSLKTCRPSTSHQSDKTSEGDPISYRLFLKEDCTFHIIIDTQRDILSSLKNTGLSHAVCPQLEWIDDNQILIDSCEELEPFNDYYELFHINKEKSLKQQIENNFSFNEILCPNNNHVLAERTNGKLSCVYYETAEKLNWTIRDKEVKVNLLLNNDPAVKDCVPKGPDDVYPTMPYRNSTHSFDVGVCEWSEK